MVLSKEVYRAFEDVVGSENICGDLAAMKPAYHASEIGAVVLPKDTDEVQAVIKLCNKYNIGLSAMSTGFVRSHFPAGIIYLDLRRMNHIVEINEKNMYAVVEPYVLSGELQAELFKRGLNCNIKGSGSNCTAILRGHGHMDQSTGGDDRNQLAMEWVTMEGEIVGSGSCGSSGEWFCGDGPGPSLRGIISGRGMEKGIITKSAMKLYHWPGPSEFPLTGTSPNYTLKEMPANFMVQYLSFTSYDKMYEAEIKMGESEITFAVMGLNAAMIAGNISSCIEDEIENYERLNASTIGLAGFYVIIAASSPEEFEYNKRVLQKIVEETGGKSSEVVEDPDVAGKILIHGVRISASIRETFRYRAAGGTAYGLPVMGQRDLTMKWLAEAAEKKKVLISQGLAADDGGVFFGWGVEQGHLGKTEIFCQPSVESPEAIAAVKKWREETAMRALDGFFCVPQGAPEDIVGPRVSNYHLWLRQISQAFDPKGLKVRLGSLMG